MKRPPAPAATLAVDLGASVVVTTPGALFNGRAGVVVDNRGPSWCRVAVLGLGVACPMVVFVLPEHLVALS